MPALPPTSPSNEGYDDINLSEVARTLVHRWRTIAAITAVATMLAILYLLFYQPKFTVSSSLYLGDTQSAQGGTQAAGLPSGLSFLYGFESASNVETQIELIRTRALLERAILETGLNASVVREGKPSLDFWRWRLYYGKQIDAYAPRRGDLTASFATFEQPTSETATFELVAGAGGKYRIFKKSDASFTASSLVLTGSLGEPASGGGLSLLLKPAIKGEPPVEGSRFILKVTPAAIVEQHLARGLLSISAGGTLTQPTKIANLSLTWTNPYDGKHFLNQLMRDFVATQLSWKTETAGAMEKFISSQLQNIRSSLSKADRQLATYQSQTGILAVPENARALIGQLSQYEVQRTTIELQKEALQQLAHELAHPSNALNPYLLSQTNDLVLGKLAEHLATDQAKLQGLRVQFTPTAAQIRVAEATITELKGSIRTLIHNDLTLAKTNLTNIGRLINKFETSIKTMPSESLRVTALARSSEVLGKLYVLLMEKKEEAEISKAATVIATRVVTPAELPLEASKPRAKPTLLIGVFLGLFVGVTGVIGQRALSGRFQNEDEIRRVTSLPVYSLIPRRLRDDIKAGIIFSQPQSPFAEAFRLLRGNLYQSASSQQSRVVAITSAAPGDGKTTVAANLAKTLADDNKSVVLVDVDLHRGNIHEIFRVDQAPGMAEWLVNAVRPAFQSIAGERFVVLPSGVLPPNPSELLNNPILEQIIDELRREFDFVVLDCPPFPLVSDVATLGRYADLVLSPVRIKHTRRATFAIHLESLGALPCRRGIVVNDVMATSYGYEYAYGYGYAEIQGRRKLLKRLRRVLKGYRATR